MRSTSIHQSPRFTFRPASAETVSQTTSTVAPSRSAEKS
jgi:hypothetical protein